MLILDVANFEQWREVARDLLRRGVSPHEVSWTDDQQQNLFGEETPPPNRTGVEQPRVPKAFLALAEAAACYRHPARWALLYRVVSRLNRGEPHLLDLASDQDVRKLTGMAGEVNRDVHKMHAFVRFRRVEGEQGEVFVAWHEPAHLIVERATPFFARRFQAMHWSILTPDRCAYWNGKELTFGAGLTRADAPGQDATEELWKTYYRHIFNPARIKLQAMATEMPKRYWHTMPETALIPSMLAESHSRVEQMMRDQEQGESPASIAGRMLSQGTTLDELRQRAVSCQACELYKQATSTVFGEGPPQAELMLVGEQPGDQEDRQGRPFVGPAGQLLRGALESLGISPDSVYLSNTVKHFRWVASPSGGKRRLHQRATARQISTCKGWVEAEIAIVKPKVLVCLGATAGQALLGSNFRLGADRGKWLSSSLAEQVMATVHPSFLLRIQDEEEKVRQHHLFLRDLQMAVAAVTPERAPSED